MCDIGVPNSTRTKLPLHSSHVLAALRTFDLKVTLPVCWAVINPSAFTEGAEIHTPEEPILAFFELAQIKVQ